MIARPLFLFSVLTLGIGSSIGLAGEAELSIVREEVRVAREEASLAEQSDLRKPITAADRVFSVPERENRIAQAIAEVVAASREGAGHDESKVWEARSSLDDLLSLLGNLGDPRLVRLIAPLLAENGTVVVLGNQVRTPAQKLAARTLSELGMKGEINLGNIQRVPGVDDLRLWWKENRDKYGPVPQPLRAIDAGFGAEPVVSGDHPPAKIGGPPISPEPSRRTWLVSALVVSTVLLGWFAAEMTRRRKGRLE